MMEVNTHSLHPQQRDGQQQQKSVADQVFSDAENRSRPPRLAQSQIDRHTRAIDRYRAAKKKTNQLRK